MQDVIKKFWRTLIWSWSKPFIRTWIPMGKKSLLKCKRPTRSFQIRNLKLITTRIINAPILREIPMELIKKLTAPNQNRKKQALAILIIHIGHTRVKTLMIISTIIVGMLLPKANLKINENRNTIITSKKIKMGNISKNRQISIDNKNLPDLRLHGKSIKGESNLRRRDSFSIRLQNRERWETSWKLWEDSLLITTSFGEGTIFGTTTFSTVLRKWTRRESNNFESWCLRRWGNSMINWCKRYQK